MNFARSRKMLIHTAVDLSGRDRHAVEGAEEQFQRDAAALNQRALDAFNDYVNSTEEALTGLLTPAQTANQALRPTAADPDVVIDHERPKGSPWDQ